MTAFARAARRGLEHSLATAVRCSDRATDFRTAISRFEDDLFTTFPEGHQLVEYEQAEAMLSEIFRIVGRSAPRLAVVRGFTNPHIGAFADIDNQQIAIERGRLYRFLVLHESAHFIVPSDRRHGPAFTYVLQLLYRSFVGIPECAVRRFLKRHRLPSYTGVANRTAT